MDPPGPSNENGGASAAADFQTFPLARDEILTLAERSAGMEFVRAPKPPAAYPPARAAGAALLLEKKCSLLAAE